MAFTNSSLVSYTQISPNRNSPRNQPITKITIHHMAGVMSVEQFGNLVANPAREMSANYAIGNDGCIGLFCEEKDRSWCSSSPWNDNRAITIEVSNDVNGEPWSISDKAYESLIKLCADICKRNGIKTLEFTGDRNGSLTFHYMFAPTACPGTWIKNHTQEICNKVNALLSGKIEPQIKEVYRIRKSRQEASSQIGAYSNLENAKKACKEGYNVYDSKGNVVYSVPVEHCKADIIGLQKILNIGGAGLVVDGIVGNKTLSAVKKYTVESGDTGNLIEWVQNRLNQLGYNCGVADGVAGQRTMGAIYEWQKAHNLSVGYLGGGDWAILLKK
jgi:N-acetyl-anhydromuramyl-L-alanine amidase AmpD